MKAGAVGQLVFKDVQLLYFTTCKSLVNYRKKYIEMPPSFMTENY